MQDGLKVKYRLERYYEYQAISLEHIGDRKLLKKALRFNLEYLMWFTPAFILGIGILHPAVAESAWWHALGIVLFLIIIVGIGWAWREIVRERRESKQLETETTALRQFL